MRIACVGGGPGGLFLATLVKAVNPDTQVTVFERNRADDTFGFGVVFSDAALATIHDADPVLRQALADHGVHWDAIEIRLKGERLRCDGNGMAAIARKTLLSLLQNRARSVGVDLRFQREVSLDDLTEYDLVVAADGANSRIRTQLASAFRPTAETATAKFIWFGTSYLFDGLTFVHERGPDGAFAVHGYPISRDVSTFIVETDEESWLAAGLDEFDVDQPPGTSDLKTKNYLEKLFAHQIDGQPLLVNNSRWSNFRTHRSGTWHHGNVALLGDAAHTAHFSVGSGTKMAMEDAVALAAALATHPGDVDAALDAYERAARPLVEKIQNSARPSLSWWEHFGRYHDAFDPWQFAIHFLSRSINVAKLAARDPRFIETVRDAWRAKAGSEPLRTPLSLGDTVLHGRLVAVAPLADGARLVPAEPGTRPVPLYRAPPSDRVDRPWGLWVDAPEEESGLAMVVGRLHTDLRSRPDVVAVHGGTRLSRLLVSEQVRLTGSTPSLIVDDQLSRDDAETIVLSGRADLVGGFDAKEM